VHLYWGHYPSLLGLLILRFLPDLPVTQSLSAYDLHSRYGPGLILSRSVPVVFTLARANRQEIESLGVNPERIRVVYHGIDSETQSRNPETKHGLTVTVAERLIPLKRTDLSIRAFGLVRNSHPDAVLTILGDGPERAKLVALASKLGLSSAVRFMGHVSHGQVYDHFRKSRVFTTMSSSERLPNTVKEAMFAGCVCVVSRTVGIEELIEHGASGFIVEQEDIEAAARAISQSLVDWPSTAELRAAAAKHIENNFSSGATARRRIGIWQGLLERCQPRQLDVPE
jgi:glycosyltransferase involved in cell wall biosynthesis